jgi:hypothetical protein
MIRKGHKPTSNACLLSEEMNIINDIISPLWSSLEPVRESWWASVMDGSVPSLMKEIGQIFSKRYELLAKFASVTTKRLQIIREIIGNPKASKRNLTRSHVLALISERAKKHSLAQDFLSELKSICGADWKRLLDTYNIQYDILKRESSESIILAQIILAYRKAIPKDENLLGEKIPIDNTLSLVLNADKIVKDYGTVRAKLIALKGTLQRALGCKVKEIAGFCIQKAYNLCESLLPMSKWTFAKDIRNFELLTFVLSISGINLESKTHIGVFNLIEELKTVMMKHGVHEKRTLPDKDYSNLRDYITKSLVQITASANFFKTSL